MDRRGGEPSSIRGLTTWSTNRDRYCGWEFSDSHRPFPDALA